MKGLLSLNVLAVTLVTWLGGRNVNAQQCIDVFHNGCSGDLNAYYLAITRSRDLCQAYCSVEPMCKFFRWTSDNQYGHNCYLYDEPFSAYANHCAKISGLKYTTADCLSPVENTCQIVQQSRCSFGTSAETDEVPTLEFCANSCQLESSCNRWVFDKENNKCTTIRDDSITCREIFGIPGQHFSDCGQTPDTTVNPGPTTEPPIDIDCPVSTELALYPDPDDCAAFYQCSKGVITHERCPDCDLFDTDRSNTCQLPSTVDCHGRHEEPCQVTTVAGDCPLKDGYFPVDNCIKYVVCQGGNPQYMTCDQKVDANGVNRQLLYNDELIQCDWDDRVTCGDRPVCGRDADDSYCQCQYADPVTPGSECPPTGIAILPNPFNCMDKIVCRDGNIVQTVPCPDGSYYDPNIADCSSDPKVCADRPICAPGGCYCVQDFS